MLIFIIAVMSAVIVPSYSRFLAKSRYQSSVESVMNLLDWAPVNRDADRRKRYSAVRYAVSDPCGCRPAAGAEPGPADCHAVRAGGHRNPSNAGTKLGETAAVANYQVNANTNEYAIPGMQQQGASPSQDLTFYPDARRTKPASLLSVPAAIMLIERAAGHRPPRS